MSAHTRRRTARRGRGAGTPLRAGQQPTPVHALPVALHPAASAMSAPDSQFGPGAPGTVLTLRGVTIPPARRRHRGLGWIRVHRLSLVIVAGLLVTVGLVHWIGYDRFPGRATDDEGTYVSQAWAVQQWHSLAHYTYWYDHPPAGWITMAAYTWATDAFDRLPTSVTVGREFMVWVNVVSAAMIYLLARRLRFHRLAAAGAVLLFGLSPLAIPFQRMVYLDNLAVMWTLAALVLAASPRRSLAASAGSAICFAIAVLSKETIAVLFPALFLLLWQHTSPKTRRYSIALFLTLLGAVVFVYPLYAILKNELFEGPGHVSLIWAIKWQLFDRAPSGSLLDPSSDTHAVARSWLDNDPLLLGAGVLLTPLGLLIRRTRAVGLALAIQVVMLFRNGYLPFPYVIAMLPFAALTIAGVADQLCKGPADERRLAHPERSRTTRAWLVALTRRTGQLAIALAVAASLVVVGPAWGRGVHQAMTEDHSQPPRQALAYVLAHVPQGSVLLVDNNLWTDLVRKGFDPNPVWFYKLDLDPAIRAKYRNGWRDIDYILLSEYTATTLKDLPLVAAAIRHSDVVASFGDGDIAVRKVIKNAPD
jgi:4-amino-4-deoxy-L-arabinose transferase-like glycosyltransferase